MTVKIVESLEQFKTIIKGDKPAVFDFWATWCGPCRMISPHFAKLSNETEGVEFYKVDVDEQSDIAQECGIRAMPTFLWFQKGEKQSEVVGANPQALNELITRAKNTQ